MQRCTAVELSYQLGDLPDRATYLAAARASLHEAIGGDVIGWVDIDLGAQTAEMCSDPPMDEEELRLFARVMGDFPTVHHYRLHPGSFDPCRISDVLPARKWRSHHAYREFFRPMGVRHQLAIAVPPRTATRGFGWFVNRDGSDFSDKAVTVARALFPVLAVLNRVCAAPIVDREAREQAREQAGLTPRELDVLALLAQGLTARQIATVRRISVRTVNKHVEHLYRKLGCNDRLQAANKARDLGLVR